MMDDQKFMEIALELAARGRGFTSPNPMVGAVIVRAGKIVGRGFHQAAGGPHAEVHAIDDAGPEARDATLYVTLEPCNHTGKTPPCTRKILAAGIRRVVMAMEDPNPDVDGGGAAYLQQQGIEVGQLEEYEGPARKLNEFFIKYSRTKRPFVIVKCAATLDGRIATRTGNSKWVTGEKSREFVHRIRHAVDGILVGINTVRQDNPSLTTRLTDMDGRDPARIILDTHQAIAPDARVLHLPSTAETILVNGASAGSNAKNISQTPGVRGMSVPVKNGLVDMAVLMEQLGASGITSVLIEGGARVIASAFKAGIVDKICFFYAPKISGGDDGVPICRGSGPDSMADCIRVKDLQVHRFDDDVMIEGYIEKA